MRLLFILLLATAVSAAAAPDYSFTLEGEAFHPKILPVMSDRKGAPAPGDVGFAGDVPFVLQGPGHYRLRILSVTGQHLLCKIGDDPEFLAGVVLPFGPHELPTADWQTTTLTVRDPQSAPTPDTAPESRVTLPGLPGTLRYLAIDCPDDRQLIRLDSSPLEALPHLAYLSIGLTGESVSLELLQNCRKLRNLSIEGGRLARVESLNRLSDLRFLKLRAISNLESVDFASELPELRVLKIDQSPVTDLRPLAGAKNLRLLSANETNVASLPDLSTLAALRDLRLHSTPVSKNKESIKPLRSRVSILVKNWDPAIKGFEKHDAEHAPPESPLLFIGSSSIRMWDLPASFPGHPVMNRGFGGSELSDSLRYFDRIVLPYRPRAILLYAGDNDIGNGESVDQVVADYQIFAAKVRAQLPKTDFAYIPIKPSLKRWELWPEMKKANEAIRKLTEADSRLHYLDTATPMLGADGTPRKDLFLDDGLHLNPKGYALWNEVVAPWLAEL